MLFLKPALMQYIRLYNKTAINRLTIIIENPKNFTLEISGRPFMVITLDPMKQNLREKILLFVNVNQ